MIEKTAFKLYVFCLRMMQIEDCMWRKYRAAKMRLLQGLMIIVQRHCGDVPK